jgi:tetrahydromethanopterin S-methyltransferase subunit G
VLETMDIRMARLEGAYEQVADRLNGIEARLDVLDRKVDGRCDSLDRKIDAKFNILAGLMASSWVTIILAVLFHH